MHHAKPSTDRNRRTVGHQRPLAPSSSFIGDVDMTDTDPEKSPSPSKGSRVSRAAAIRGNRIPQPNLVPQVDVSKLLVGKDRPSSSKLALADKDSHTIAADEDSDVILTSSSGRPNAKKPQ